MGKSCIQLEAVDRKKNMYRLIKFKLYCVFPNFCLYFSAWTKVSKELEMGRQNGHDARGKLEDYKSFELADVRMTVGLKSL